MPVIAQFHFCPVFDGGGVTRFDVLPLSFHDGECIIEILLYDVFTTGVVFSQKRVQMFLTVRSCAFPEAVVSVKRQVRQRYRFVRREPVACSASLWQASGR